MRVPFLDLQSQHERIRDELRAAMDEVIDACAFIGGPAVKALDQELAAHMERRFARSVSNCTAALAMTMRHLRLEPGDEVITTVHTAIPTAEAIGHAGGSVVFADVGETTWLIDPDDVESKITPRTRALLPVHLYGMAAPIERILEIAAKHDLVVIEDVAQAQGARYRGRRLGSFGLAGCLSFFPSKNLGGFGDGGAVVTDDEDLQRYVAMYSNHGRLEKFTHEIEGANERMDALQAAVLRVKLRRLDEWNARRREVAGWYAADLAGVEGLELPAPIEGCEPVWHLYVVLVKDRDGLARHLKEAGVATGLHYPLALHQQPAFARLGHAEGAFPVAERVTRECLSLPMDPFLTREQVAHVARSVREFLEG